MRYSLDAIIEVFTKIREIYTDCYEKHINIYFYKRKENIMSKKGNNVNVNEEIERDDLLDEVEIDDFDEFDEVEVETEPKKKISKKKLTLIGCSIAAAALAVVGIVKACAGKNSDDETGYDASTDACDDGNDSVEE